MIVGPLHYTKSAIRKAITKAQLMAHPKAETFHRKWNSFSRPILVTCDDGKKYVLKGAHCGKAIVNEQIVARLGTLIDAPTCPTTLVEIPAELCAINPEMSDIAAGLAHGIEFVDDCSDRAAIDHTGLPENRPRFAALQVLYTWLYAGDQQLIYRTVPPHLVYSVDHGHFFPGGPNWTAANLAAAPPITQYDPTFGIAAITGKERMDVLARLSRLTDSQINQVLSIPPSTWGFDDAERTALEQFIKQRKVQVIALPTTL